MTHTPLPELLTKLSEKGALSVVQDLIFKEARTHRTWLKKTVSNELLKSIYDLMKLGPTSANCCPLRIVFVSSPEEKEKLRECLDEGNIEKTMAAPVTALFAYDLKFYTQEELGLNENMRSYFAKAEAFTLESALRNSTLQAAYFMLAARLRGVDCGPMSGFDVDKLNQTFFPSSDLRINFICNLGYGKTEDLNKRKARLSFDQVCKSI